MKEKEESRRIEIESEHELKRSMKQRFSEQENAMRRELSKLLGQPLCLCFVCGKTENGNGNWKEKTLCHLIAIINIIILGPQGCCVGQVLSISSTVVGFQHKPLVFLTNCNEKTIKRILLILDFKMLIIQCNWYKQTRMLSQGNWCTHTSIRISIVMEDEF